MNSEDKITFGSKCGGVGDNLAFTPLMKHFNNCTLELLNHPKSRNIAPLFDGLCSINFTENPRGVKESKHPHVAQQKIEGYGIAHLVNCIPKIKLHPYEIEEARAELVGIKNPIAFVGNSNGSGDVNDLASRYRVPPTKNLQNLVSQLSEEHTVLQFGLSKNITNLDKSIKILDLPLRMLAAYYSVIGKYFGIDTGDYHLMLAVGGSCEVICPTSSGHYSHDCWHYTENLWKDEPRRVKYNIY